MTGGLRRRAAGATLGQVGGRLLGAALSLATLRVATGYLSTTQFGEYVAATAIVLIAVTACDLGLSTIAARDAARAPADAEVIFGRLLTLRLALTVAAIPVTLLASLGLYHSEPALIGSIIVLSPTIAVQSLQVCAYAVFISRGRSGLCGVGDVTARSAVFGLCLAVIALNLGYNAFLAANVIGAGAGCLTALVMAHCSPLHPARYLRSRATYAFLLAAAPLGVALIINVLYLRFDTIFLSLLRSPAEVGEYGIAYRVIEFVMAVPSFFMLALLPDLARADRDRLRTVVDRAFVVMLAVAVPVTLVLVLYSSDVVAVGAASSYSRAATPLAILSLGAGISFFTAVFGNVLVARDLQSYFVPIGLTTLGLNVALNLWLVPALGTTGAALSVVATEFVGLGVVGTVFVWKLHLRPSVPDLRSPAAGGVFLILSWAVIRHVDMLSGFRLGLGSLLAGVVYTAVYATTHTRGHPKRLLALMSL